MPLLSYDISALKMQTADTDSVHLHNYTFHIPEKLCFLRYRLQVLNSL